MRGCHAISEQRPQFIRMYFKVFSFFYLYFFAQVVCLEQENVSLSEQLKQLKKTPSSPVKDAVSPQSASSEQSQRSNDTNLSVTAALVRDDSQNLTVGEVTKNEEVNVSTAGASSSPTQPRAEPSSNKSSPTSVRSNSSSSGPPPTVMPYSEHKKKSGSKDTTPETSPETPRKDDHPKPAAAKPKEEMIVKQETADESQGKTGATEVESSESPAMEKKEPPKTHAFMKANASSGAAALAAVMSGVGQKAKAADNTQQQQKAAPSGQDAEPTKTAPLPGEWQL